MPFVLRPYRTAPPLDRSSLVSDQPLRIALGWQLHPQGTVRGLVIVVVDPPQELTRYVFHRFETRLEK